MKRHKAAKATAADIDPATTTDGDKPLRFLRKEELLSRVGLSLSAIYELMAAGDFPPSIKITGRAVGWSEADVDAWMKARIAASQSK